MSTRVLIVDDHPGFRVVARELLQYQGFDVVGEAGDAAAALLEVHRLAPDLVLLDVGLPDADGFDLAGRLATMSPAPAVVLISSRDGSAYRKRLATSPVRGFLRKDELTGTALRALIG